MSRPGFSAADTPAGDRHRERAAAALVAVAVAIAFADSRVPVAVRAGLLGSLAEAARQAQVPAFAVPLLVRGSFGVQSLFG